MTTLLSQRVSAHFAKAALRRAMLDASSPEAWPARQLDALRAIWADAIADVPYYRLLAAGGRAPARIDTWSDVSRIPVLTRATLQDRAAEFIRDSGAPQSFMKTAGSTGEPLRIGMNAAERELMRIVKLSEWQTFGYTRSSRLFLIWGHGHLLGTGWRGRLNHARRKLTDAFLGYQRVDAYRLDRQTCRQYAEALIRFRPIGVISYGSALDLFARHTEPYRDQFRALGVRFVLSTAEAPPRPDTLARLEDLFGCAVVQEYGGAEFGQVAFKRGHAPFTAYADLNFVEAAGLPDHEPGAESLLVTSLYPRYVPLVRYRVGDAIAGAQRLPNGHVHAFDAIAGRINDMIELEPGEFVHSVAVFHCIHQEPEVYGIQMVLTDEAIEIALVAAPGDRTALEARMRQRLGQVHRRLAAARFSYVEDLNPTRAGKRRWYVDRRTHPCAASPAS